MCLNPIPPYQYNVPSPGFFPIYYHTICSPLDYRVHPEYRLNRFVRSYPARSPYTHLHVTWPLTWRVR